MDKQIMPDGNGIVATQAPRNKALRFWVGIFDYVEIFVFSVCIVFVLFSLLGRFCLVDGESMNQTLQNTERLLISDVLGELETGDIVVFHMTGVHDKPLVKRVIATGGQTVRIDYDTCRVYVDDQLVEDPLNDPKSYVYFAEYSGYANRSVVNLTVPEGQVFVMGDNRNHSSDSRYFGCIDERRVLGKVVCRIRPFTWFLN